MSLATGFVTLDWKIARVTPAYKDKGDVQDKTNYRQLPMVIHLAKVFERQIQIQLTGYLSLTSCQSMNLYKLTNLRALSSTVHKRRCIGSLMTYSKI